MNHREEITIGVPPSTGAQRYLSPPHRWRLRPVYGGCPGVGECVAMAEPRNSPNTSAILYPATGYVAEANASTGF